MAFPRVVIALLALTAATGDARGVAGHPSEAPAPASSPEQAAAIERTLREAVRRTPSRFEPHHHLGEFYIRQGRLEDAIRHLEKAQAIEPSHYVNGYDLAVAYLKAGVLAQARRQVQRSLQLKDTAELHNLLGDVEEQAGHLLPAAEAYQRAAHMEPSEEHLFDWGNNLLQLRAFEPASQVFGAAVERHPASARLVVGLGIARYSLGQYDDAVQSFCRAADLDPSDHRAYHFLGEMYGVSPELAGEVERRLAQLVATQPSNALAHYYHALSLWKGQSVGPASPADVARIERRLKKAAALDPQLARAHLQLGILYSGEGRYPHAVRALQAAIRLAPGVAEAHYRLAHAYRRTGQQALASRELAIFQQLKAEQAEPQPPSP